MSPCLSKVKLVSDSEARVDELLLRIQKIQAIKRPTKRSQSNLSNLISNTQSLVSDESDWIRCGPDLAALGRDSEHGWLNTFLEDILNKISMRLTMVCVPRIAYSSYHPYPSTLFHPRNHPDCILSRILFPPSMLQSLVLTETLSASSAVMSRGSRLETKTSNFCPTNVSISFSIPS